MIAYNPSAGFYARGFHPRAPVFSISEREVLIDPGTTVTQTENDAVVTNHTGATIETNQQIIPDGFYPTSFAILSGSATISSSGYVQSILESSGNSDVKILAETGPDQQVLQTGVSLVDPGTITTLESWVAGSYGKYASESGPALVADKTGTSQNRQVFVEGARNPDLFCSAYSAALTGIAWWGSHYGTYIGFTAITSRHVVSCAHAGDATGHSVNFITSDGNEVVRQLVRSYIGPGIDRITYLLDSDLPSSIVPIPLLPANFVSYMTHPAFRLPCIFIDRDNLANYAEFFGMIPANCFIQAPAGNPGLSFYTEPVTGTSGKPIMALTGASSIALISTFSSPGAGPSLHALDWSSAIAALDASAGISTGYVPTRANLSAFTEYA